MNKTFTTIFKFTSFTDIPKRRSFSDHPIDGGRVENVPFSHAVLGTHLNAQCVPPADDFI